MRASEANGHLLIIGGAEDKEEECKILSEFVRLAGAEDARIVVIAVASETPSEIGGKYVEVFKRLGAAGVRRLRIRRRDEANAPAAIEVIGQATGVFFTGGN